MPDTSVFSTLAQDTTVAAVATSLNTGTAHTDSAAILAKLPTSPALDATVAGIATSLNTGTAHADSAAILAKLPSTPATAAGQGTLKAASTAAAAGDSSLVVGLSPNSPVPAGTNEIGAVRLRDNAGTGLVLKAASTAAVAADPSLVVGLSPNSPVPTGSNTIGKVRLGTSSVADAQAVANVDQIALGIFNGTTVDAARGASGASSGSLSKVLAVAVGTVPTTSINAASVIVAGTNHDNSTARPSHTLQVDVTTTTAGTAGTHTVLLEGSLDGTNFTQLGTVSPAASSTTGSNASNHANASVNGFPYRYVRANWTATPTSWVGTLTARVVSA